MDERTNPNHKRFTVRRVTGSGETQFFAAPFEPGPQRAHLVERMAP